jgi:hypothetical protein
MELPKVASLKLQVHDDQYQCCSGVVADFDVVVVRVDDKATDSSVVVPGSRAAIVCPPWNQTLTVPSIRGVNTQKNQHAPPHWYVVGAVLNTAMRAMAVPCRVRMRQDVWAVLRRVADVTKMYRRVETSIYLLRSPSRDIPSQPPLTAPGLQNEPLRASLLYSRALI